MPVRFNLKDVKLLNTNYSLGRSPEEEPGAEDGFNSDQEKSVLRAELRCKANYDKDKRLLRIILGVSTGSHAKPSFSLDVEMGAVFMLDSDPTEAELQSMSYINCPAIVFPYLREFVTEITRRAGIPQVYLPPVNFVNMHRDLIAESNEELPPA